MDSLHFIVIGSQSNNVPHNQMIKFVHFKNLECSKLGYYRDVLKDECVPCPFGTYSDTENAVNAESCNVCGKERTASEEGTGNNPEEETASGEGTGNNPEEETVSGEGSTNSPEEETASEEGSENSPERQTTSGEGSTSNLQCYLGIIIFF